MADPELIVKGSDLHDALRSLRKFSRRLKGFDATLSYEEGGLLIQAGGVGAAASAEGSWPGVATAPLIFFVRGLTGIPKEDTVRIWYEVGRLHVANQSWKRSIGATWTPQGRPSVQVSLNASLIELLRLAINHSPADLESMGVLRKVQAAAERRDQLVQRAAELLNELEIEHSSLEALVDRHVRTELT